MTGMNIQDRYDDICKTSGLSEEVVRRVLKAARQSLVKSIKNGERATLPGIVTITPSFKNKIDIGGNSMTQSVKLKAKPSASLETDLNNITEFIQDVCEDNTALSRLNIKNPELVTAPEGIITNQIDALL